MSTVLILVIVAMVIGAAGTVLPILPGIPLIFCAALFYGWFEGFKLITPTYLVILGILTVFSVLFSYLSTTFGARYFGSGRAGSWGAVIGLVLGIFVFPPIGILLGPFLGAFLGEYLTKNDPNQAVKAALGALIGLFSGIVFNLLIALGMLISFLIIVF